MLASGAAYERDGAAWVRVPPRTTIVHDLVKGDVVFEHDAMADFAVRKPDGGAAHILASAVDDATMRIDLVLQSDEHLDGAARQICSRARSDTNLRASRTAGSILDAASHQPDEHRTGAGIDDFRRAGYLPAADHRAPRTAGLAPPDG